MAKPPGALRRFVARHAPTRHQLIRTRWLKPVRRYISAQEYWRFTRRSVPRAAMIGMFIGVFLMLPGIQMIAAAAMAVPIRANIPMAAAVTWISNPLTTPAFLIAGLEVGSLFGFPTDIETLTQLVREGATIREWTAWVVSDAAPAMLFGLFVIALVLALVAYGVSLVGWRLWIARRWKHRHLHY